ncbi:protein kinase [Microbulbifer sp. SAOS-129_SWC]|uniref:protein kinase domain-containing protein n=1 Tax=Microbulbifer sp. SAOS-129_SWC TaxID=3145235 RepID=UPI0032171C5D
MEVAEPELGLDLDPDKKGRYRTERALGAGGMGIVYLAEDTRLQRQVAIKQLRKDSTSASASARIHSEAQLLARLNHSNIVQLYDVLEENGSIALVMEYVEGTTLKEWMREYSAPLKQKLDLLLQICAGLGEAHRLGILHRDLKPDNILITRNGAGGFTAKITDFGIAKSLQHEGEQITREDQVAGTVEAMSPEQLQGFPLDPRSDLFSLGAVAYELLCGARPFDGGEGGAMALAHKIVSEAHIPPQRTNPALPASLAALLDRLLAKEPGKRPDSVEQVGEALAFLQQVESDTDTREFSATVTQLLRKPPSTRRRNLRAAAGALGVAALGVAGYFAWDYATRLDPQYIAVLPVEMHGDVRGEDNAKTLTKTMVRQALMNAAAQLKASALVSFTPKDGQDFDAQLQKLRDKGVTDALFARLDCAQVRCEIELQRLNPVNSQIRQQAGFAFLVDKRQEAEYRIANSATGLFPSDYAKDTIKQIAMSERDYSDYLNIISRMESKENSKADLQRLGKLLGSYPQNPNLYRTYTQVATNLFVLTDDKADLQSGLDMLERAKARKISPILVLELELWLRTYSADKSQFDALIKQFDKQEAPSAALLAKYARYLFTQGDYESALQYAEQATALNPSADNLYLIALNHALSGNYTQARNILKKNISAHPEHWSSYSALGNIEMESGNFTAAEKAITSIPEKLRGWRTKSNLGAIYFLQGKYSQALKVYQQVLTSVPDNVPAIEQIAETYLLLGETPESISSFNRLLELTRGKKDLRSRQFRSEALANVGRIDEAILLTKDLLREAPDDTYVQYAAAQVYANAEEWRSASYHIENLLRQGMSAEWFNLPAFQQLCTQPQVSAKVRAAICD